MSDTDEEFQKLQEEIVKFIPFEDFIRIETRLEDLRKEEEAKLRALSELQQAFVAANSDFERDYVKQMVGRIREMSRVARAEIRALNQEIIAHNLTLEKARELFERVRSVSETYNPK